MPNPRLRGELARKSATRGPQPVASQEFWFTKALVWGAWVGRVPAIPAGGPVFN